MKLSDFLRDINGLSDCEISGVTFNPKKVTENTLFVCVKGPTADGHNAAAEALNAGAAAVVCERDLGLERQIIVDDTHEFYFGACAKWFGEPLKSLKLIGITGTNGKTSVSYMLKAAFEAAGHKCGLIGTIQHLIGDEPVQSNNTTPGAYELNELFAKMRDSGCDTVIMEVSSHALDQRRICGVTFDAAIFTNLTQDHLDYHKTFENYLLAKRKLFQMCDTAVVNIDDDADAKLLDGLSCKRVTYSASVDDSTYSAKGISYRADGVDFDFVGYGVIGRVRMQTGGKFSVYNALAAISAAVTLGIPAPVAAKAISDMPVVKGRAESVPTGRDFHIIIDYAHTPDGLQNIISTFRDVPHKRIVTLFGCGGDRDKTKRPIMGKIAAQLSDLVIVTSDNPRTENPAAIIKDILGGMKEIKTPHVVIENRVEAIKYAVKHAQAGDIIVLAGKGHETYQILNTGKIHLDEREVVKAALEELK